METTKPDKVIVSVGEQFIEIPSWNARYVAQSPGDCNKCALKDKCILYTKDINSPWTRTMLCAGPWREDGKAIHWSKVN